ncbi:MAG: FIST N-terminal domain-containing protein [Cystobacter sp.]
MTVSIGVGVGQARDTREAVRTAVEQARAGVGGADLQAAYVTATVDHEAATVHATLRELLPGVRLHGVTTSLGVLSPGGVLNEGYGALAVMLFGGPPGLAFVASSSDADGERAGEAAARELVRQAGGRRPRVILFNASPGQEEAMLQGVARACPDTPCSGGSAADHAIAGEWSVFTQEGPLRTGVSLLGLFGELRVGTALTVPFVPTSTRARATASEGRTLLTLDDQPAASVIGRWMGGTIDEQLQTGGNILAQTAMRPIAVRRELAQGVHYMTVHQSYIHADRGAVDVFARIESRDEVCLMSGTPEGVLNEVAHLIDMTLAQGGMTARDVKGATLVFCAGCAGALGPRIDEGLRTFSRLLPGVPMLGLCAFGEQGHVPGLGNVHQNLSLSLTLFADEPS